MITWPSSSVSIAWIKAGSAVCETFSEFSADTAVATGAVAGLVAITPASGFVNVLGAVVIGLGAGLICFFAVELIHKTSLDDALDVFAVHGVGGIWGAIATGLFASASYGVGVDGIFSGGDISVLTTQIIAVVAFTLLLAHSDKLLNAFLQI